MNGFIHSIQSLGTVDGPGVRFTVFLQGCNLRCKCCHNPDTWSADGGKEYSPKKIVDMAMRYREYFGKTGGITFSGGEPLLQSKFAYEVFKLCKEIGINTCLDTSGSIINPAVEQLLSVTDCVLLDIKYTDEQLYNKNVGCSLSTVLKFLDMLNDRNIPTTIRQVIIPTVNDSTENIMRLKEIISAYPCVTKTELLPFKKICQVKYDNMNLEFPFGNKEVPTKAQMKTLEALLEKN